MDTTGPVVCQGMFSLLTTNLCVRIWRKGQNLSMWQPGTRMVGPLYREGSKVKGQSFSREAAAHRELTWIQCQEADSRAGVPAGSRCMTLPCCLCNQWHLWEQRKWGCSRVMDVLKNPGCPSLISASGAQHVLRNADLLVILFLLSLLQDCLELLPNGVMWISVFHQKQRKQRSSDVTDHMIDEERLRFSSCFSPKISAVLFCLSSFFNLYLSHYLFIQFFLYVLWNSFNFYSLYYFIAFLISFIALFISCLFTAFSLWYSLLYFYCFVFSFESLVSIIILVYVWTDCLTLMSSSWLDNGWMVKGHMACFGKQWETMFVYCKSVLKKSF